MSRRRPFPLLAAMALACLAGLVQSAQAQFSYTTNNGAITITQYTGPGGAVVIPGTINGLPVVSIGQRAFFSDYISPTSVTIPNSVTSVGAEAFYGCFYLTNVTFGKGVTNIGAGVFIDCVSLARITVAAGNPAYSSVSGVLFNHSQTVLIAYPGGLAGSYMIPNGVTNIEDSAFYGCSLTNIIISTNVTSIGVDAFFDCPILASLTVTTGNLAYSSVNGVLFNHSQTMLVAYPGGLAGNYVIPNGVTNIETGAFQYSKLTGVTIPNSVTSIGSATFLQCYHLTGVTIPNSVINIRDSAFENCDSLTNVTIPDSVTNIGDSAFEYCDSLASITIPNNVISIGASAFSGCGYLTNVTMGSSLSSIGDGAFSDCYYLTSITVPNSVTNIGEGAFVDCARLASITVAAGNPAYSSVNGVLFDHNQTMLITFPGGLAGNYVIPNGVTSIGASAFQHCYQLSGV